MLEHERARGGTGMIAITRAKSTPRFIHQYPLQELTWSVADTRTDEARGKPNGGAIKSQLDTTRAEAKTKQY